MKFTEKIEKYLVSNQLHLAIDDFLKLLGEVPTNSPAKNDANELRSQVIVLAGRYNSLNDKIKLGTINSETSTIEKTTIVNSFVDILNGLSSTYDELDKFIHTYDEEHAWQQAQSDNNIEGYQSYFTKYPNGKYLSETQKLITELGEIKHKQESEIKRVAQEEKLRRVQERNDNELNSNQNKNNTNYTTSKSNPVKSNKLMIYGVIGVVVVAIVVFAIFQLSKSKNENNSNTTSNAAFAADSARKADSTRMADSITNANNLTTPTDIEEVRTILNKGEEMIIQDPLFSANREYFLVLQEDGNLVIYKKAGHNPIWATGFKPDAKKLLLQEDGNLCIYDSQNTFLWGSSTSDGDHLVLENDGTLNLYPIGSSFPTWSSAKK